MIFEEESQKTLTLIYDMMDEQYFILLSFGGPRYSRDNVIE